MPARPYAACLMAVLTLACAGDGDATLERRLREAEAENERLREDVDRARAEIRTIAGQVRMLDGSEHLSPWHVHADVFVAEDLHRVYGLRLWGTRGGLRGPGGGITPFTRNQPLVIHRDAGGCWFIAVLESRGRCPESVNVSGAAVESFRRPLSPQGDGACLLNARFDCEIDGGAAGVVSLAP